MISVFNTGVANSASVLYALERLGYTATLTCDPEKLSKSSKVILPGVGSANAVMEKVQSKELADSLRGLKQPVLGICLGMQMLYEFSDEGGVPCLGIFSGKISRLSPKNNLPVPHMGWNQVFSEKQSILLKGIPEGSYFYFVHSFFAPQGPEMTASADYGGKVPSIIEYSNWYGTQFHPERSGPLGEKLINNFLEL